MTARYDALFTPHLKQVVPLGGDRVLATCPFHDDAEPSMSIDLEAGLYFCFGCGAKGNAKTFQRALDLDDVVIPPPSLGKLRHKLKRMRESNGYREPEEVSITTMYPGEDVWLQERGFSAETVRRWELGFDPFANTLLIPVRSLGGRPVGIIRRPLFPGEGKKYLNPPGWPKGVVVYGAHLVRTSWVCITEGPLDAVALSDAGIPAVAIMGNRMTAGQAQVLLQTGVEAAVVALDDDEQGREAADILAAHEGLRGLRISRAFRWGAKDPGEVSISARIAAVRPVVSQEMWDETRRSGVKYQ